MSKFLFILLFLSVFFGSITTQLIANEVVTSDTIQSVVRNNTVEPQVKQSKRTYSIGHGFAMGPENILTFIFPPKLSFNIYNKYTQFTNYYGADISGIFLFQTIYSGSIFYGWQFKKFTFDSSFSVLHVPEQDSWDGHLERHTSLLLNPKIGFRTRFFWLKFGPGFPIYNPLRQLDYKSFRSYNFDIAVHVPLGSKY